MSNVDFTKLLSRSAAEVKRPVPLPPGTYFGITQQYILGASKQKGTPSVEYPIQIIRAGEDVDSSLLEGIDLSKKTFKGVSNRGGTFYFTDESEYRLKDFIASTGISITSQSWDELLPMAVGKEVMVSIKQVPSEKNGEMYNNLESAVGTGS